LWGTFSELLPIQDANAASQLCSRSVWQQGLNFLPFLPLTDVQLPEGLTFIRVKFPTQNLAGLGDRMKRPIQSPGIQEL
jgi:hypothetical protein